MARMRHCGSRVGCGRDLDSAERVIRRLITSGGSDAEEKTDVVVAGCRLACQRSARAFYESRPRARAPADLLFVGRGAFRSREGGLARAVRKAQEARHRLCVSYQLRQDQGNG